MKYNKYKNVKQGSANAKQRSGYVHKNVTEAVHARISDNTIKKLSIFSNNINIRHYSLNHIIRYLYCPIYEEHFIYCPDIIYNARTLYKMSKLYTLPVT